jgi:tRNA 2-selenouridine synthase
MIFDSVESVALPCDLDSFDAIIDVRSPAEFEEDHLPGAINLPVLTDDERIEVGTLHKDSPFRARRLGAAIISRNAGNHIEKALQDHPKDWAPLIYCWRGGMRSRSFAFILRSIGWRARVIEGGYKSWRNHLRIELSRILEEPALDLRVLNGLTGTAKTRLLHALAEAGAQVLDLEGLANHRGSLLGQVGPQPSQKFFESQLYGRLRAFDLTRPIFTEGESNRIGTVHLPAAYWARLPQATTYGVTLALEERSRYLLEDYDHFPQSRDHLSTLLNELRRLRGNAQVEEWQHQIASEDWSAFVKSILENHYDLAYRKPGSEGCVYPSASHTIALPNASPEALQEAARALRAQFDPPRETTP